MSLVSTYVRATDGKLYQNPTLSGKEWFICFDDKDPVELVIMTKSKLTPKDIFESIKMKYTKLTKNEVSGRLFGKRIKFQDGQSYFFEIKNRINNKFITEHDGIIEKSEIDDGVIYDPKK